MEDAAPVRADPKIVVAAIKHGVDGLIVDKIIHLDGNVLEALTVESSETGMSPAANAIRPLRYHAHVAFRQAVFYLPVLLLILRKTQDGWRRCGAGNDCRKTDEKRRNLAEYEARGNRRPRPSSSVCVRATVFHGHRPGVINESYISIDRNQTQIFA